MPDNTDVPRTSPDLAGSEEVRDLVDRASTGLALVGETLCEFTAIALALCLEVEQVADADTAVAADTVGHDLTSVKKLVQVGAAHTETIGGLVRGQDGRTVEDGELGTGTNAATQAEQHVAQLGAGAGQCVLLKRVELLDGDVRGLDSLHVSRPQLP